MKMYKGIIKKVPTAKQFEDYNNGEIEIADVRLVDTIVELDGKGGKFETLPFRLSYQDVDENGNEKYTYDSEAGVYVKAYKQTPILYATGKEMRILLELGEFNPVKLMVSENEREDKVFLNVECVQNQHMGLS
ncbi:hypothetical protein R2F61_07255 [Mollicutes bacterium LVI A0078]|nr:hypothetical protein RZE84_01875 [Mollicutes bacterium LVI A0075]WOO90520.1 hypothetical protein R2F61_07255 [Mollicutes bacterium LVI A0078]